MKPRAIHIIEDIHGRIHVQKQRRWRSAAYKARRAIRRGKMGLLQRLENRLSLAWGRPGRIHVVLKRGWNFGSEYSHAAGPLTKRELARALKRISQCHCARRCLNLYPHEHELFQDIP